MYYASAMLKELVMLIYRLYRTDWRDVQILNMNSPLNVKDGGQMNVKKGEADEYCKSIYYSN